MNVTQMRMMLVLEETKSMSAAAKRLEVSQPALSYQIKSIEEELGFTVFERTRTGTVLTREGAYLVESLHSLVGWRTT